MLILGVSSLTSMEPSLQEVISSTPLLSHQPVQGESSFLWHVCWVGSHSPNLIPSCHTESWHFSVASSCPVRVGI